MPLSLSKVLTKVLLALFLLGSSNFALSAQNTEEYQPEVGQEGKDVIWVPTPQALVDQMLGMAKVRPNDYVIDLGSGDGRTVITAARWGARAHGIEYNPEMVELSKRAAAKAKLSDRATFEKADLFESDFSKATVITMFLLPEINIKLRPKLLGLKPGTRIVSNSFDMEDWQPDQTVNVEEGCQSWCEAFLWIIPARVSGTWKTANGEISLRQQFQMLTGTMKTGNSTVAVNGKMTGDQIILTAGNNEYTGKVSGNKISGKSKNGGNWSATRASR